MENNLIVIKGKIIKQEKANKTGYYLTIQEEATGKQQGAFSQWTITTETDGIWTLRKDGKYLLIVDFQRLRKANQTEEKPKVANNAHCLNCNNILYQKTEKYYYQIQQSQEYKRLLEEKRKIEAQKDKLEQEKRKKDYQIEVLTKEIKENERIIELNKKEIARKVPTYWSIETLYYMNNRTPEQENYIGQLNTLFNRESKGLF